MTQANSASNAAASLPKFKKLVTLLKELFQLDQATINLNRGDGGRRKLLLVEMGNHFDTVMLPRLKKIAFTPDWKDGKPKRLAMPEEAERGPRLIKVLRLEAYEDTLNNLALQRSPQQQAALEIQAAKGADIRALRTLS